MFFFSFCYQIAQTGKLFSQYQYFDHFDPKTVFLTTISRNFLSKVENNHRNGFLDPKNILLDISHDHLVIFCIGGSNFGHFCIGVKTGKIVVEDAFFV